jgi:phospholipid/cholesterol/gamma-HCH transport system substrate-binding protein
MSHFYKNVGDAKLKVGLFVASCLLILFFSYSWLMDWFMASRFDSYEVLFDNVSNLERGNSVFYRGVRVGRVADMSFTTEGILVRILVDGGIKIDKGATFTIKDKDMMGTKSLEILPGSGGHEFLGTDIVHIGHSLPGFSDLISNVNTLSEKIEQLVNQINDDELFFDKIDNIIALTDKSLSNVHLLISDINQSDLLLSFTELRKASESIQMVINENYENLTETLEVTNRTFTKLDSLITFSADMLKQLHADIGREDGNLNKLLTDDELYNSIVNSTQELEKLISDIKRNPHRYFKFSIF